MQVISDVKVIKKNFFIIYNVFMFNHLLCFRCKYSFFYSILQIFFHSQTLGEVIKTLRSEKEISFVSLKYIRGVHAIKWYYHRSWSRYDTNLQE